MKNSALHGPSSPTFAVTAVEYSERGVSMAPGSLVTVTPFSVTRSSIVIEESVASIGLITGGPSNVSPGNVIESTTVSAVSKLGSTDTAKVSTIGLTPVNISSASGPLTSAGGPCHKE